VAPLTARRVEGISVRNGERLTHLHISSRSGLYKIGGCPHAQRSIAFTKSVSFAKPEPFAEPEPVPFTDTQPVSFAEPASAWDTAG